jgi:hypothetical protein
MTHEESRSFADAGSIDAAQHVITALQVEGLGSWSRRSWNADRHGVRTFSIASQTATDAWVIVGLDGEPSESRADHWHWSTWSALDGGLRRRAPKADAGRPTADAVRDHLVAAVRTLGLPATVVAGFEFAEAAGPDGVAFSESRVLPPTATEMLRCDAAWLQIGMRNEELTATLTAVPSTDVSELTLVVEGEAAVRTTIDLATIDQVDFTGGTRWDGASPERLRFHI